MAQNRGINQTLRTGLSSLLLWSRLAVGTFHHIPQGIRILTYHKVTRLSEDPLSVTVAQFEQQMNYLTDKGYDIMGLSEASKFLATTETLPERVVIITFDDGYRNNYQYVFPILKERGIKATVFLIVGLLGKEYMGEPVLRDYEVEQMAENNVEFGSHTITHPILSAISEKEAHKEIALSRDMLRKITGKEVNSFCYPFGDFAPLTRQWVKEAGYSLACSVIPGCNTKTTDPYTLRRTEISPKDSLYDLEKKLSGAYDMLHLGLQWIKGQYSGKDFFRASASLRLRGNPNRSVLGR